MNSIAILVFLFLSNFFSSFLLVTSSTSLETDEDDDGGVVDGVEDGRIVGGHPVEIKDFPYQIALLVYGKFDCGGSILDASRILTAAHCTDGLIASALSIRAGSNYAEYGGQVRRVAKICQHSSYDNGTLDYDVSVLKLSKPLDMNSDLVSAVALKKVGKEVVAGSHAVASGYGRTRSGGPLSSQLLAVKVPIVSEKECKAEYGEEAITDRMFCAGTDGMDACQGDSGGPIVSKITGTLIGVTSWGRGCGTRTYPGIFAKVSNPDIHSYITNECQ